MQIALKFHALFLPPKTGSNDATCQCLFYYTLFMCKKCRLNTIFDLSYAAAKVTAGQPLLLSMRSFNQSLIELRL